MRHLFILYFTVSFFLLLSCKSSESNLNVINGKYIDDSPNMFAVSLIMYTNANNTTGICSSTIISHNLVLTAANCVSPKKKGITLHYSILNYNGVREDHEVQPISYIVHPKYDYSNSNTYQYDLAVLVFPNGTFTGIAAKTISNKRPELNSPVAIVGYGCYTTAGKMFKQKGTNSRTKQPIFQTIEVLVCQQSSANSKFLHKRFGENIVTNSSFCPNNMIQINQREDVVDTKIDNPTGIDVAPSPGDSGGPLIQRGGSIVGVSSCVDKVLKEDRASCYVDVSAPENYQFIQDAFNFAAKQQPKHLDVIPPVTFEDL